MREAEPLVDLIDELRHIPDVPFPQVFLVDGNGRLHERQAGLAVAVGVLANVPTIGCAKDYHPLPATDNDEVPWRYSQKGFKAICKQILRERGDWIGIQDKTGQHYVGAVSESSAALKSLAYVDAGAAHFAKCERYEPDLRLVWKSSLAGYGDRYRASYEHRCKST